MAGEKLPPLPSLPPIPGSDSPPPPPPEAPPKAKSKSKRSRSGAFRHLQGSSREDRLQEFARTGFAGYRRVRVAEKRRAPRILWAGLGILALAVALFSVYQWTRPPEVEDVALGTPVVSDPDLLPAIRVDPEAWRGDIESLEDFLFSSPSEIGPLGEFGSRFGEEAGTWAERLRADGGTKELALATKLDELVASTERSDFNVRRLKEVRNAWLDLRDLGLGEAEWLHAGGGEVDQSADLEIYRDAAEQIREWLSETLATGEELASAGMNAEERRREWRETLFYFRDDLKVLRASLPRRPGAGSPAAELDAIHQLDRIFLAAQDLAESQDDISRLDTAAFESAIEKADEAAGFFYRRLGE